MCQNNFTWSAGLEGAALQIARADDSPLRVLAGPGTGKTFALMRRITRLIEQGVAPESIFVSTFTRTAARDLQNELAGLGIDGADQVYAGTIHGFCFSILSRAEVLPLTDRVPRPLLKFEQRFLLEDLRGTNGEQIRDLEKRLNAFAAAWARLQTEEPGWPHNKEDRRFLAALKSWLQFHKAMLVGELVPQALRFLRDNPASPYRPTFGHVLVDEYQDLNRAEQALLDELAGNARLTIVGDEDQSIYSFKHAHPEGIVEFAGGHPGTHDENLTICQRCPRRVVKMANALIAVNPARMPRQLQPRPEKPEGDVHVVQWPSIDKEARGLAEFIGQRVGNGQAQAGKVLVLAPRRQFGYAIRDALNNANVPAHSFFHEEALDGNPTDADQCAAQEAFTLLTLLARPDDRVALRCWCGFGSSSLRSGAWQRVREHAANAGLTPREVLEQLDAGTIRLPHTGPLVERFRLLRTRLEPLQGCAGAQLVDGILPPGESWADPLRAVVSDFAEDGDAAALLDAIQRGVTQPELPTDVDYVRVMSLHKSKGLTADLVVVAGCIEGLTPTLPRNAAEQEQQRAIEEQRRLFYVAITRTRQTLVLSSVTRLPRDQAHRMGARVTGNRGRHTPTIASRFLDELGPTRPHAVRGDTIIANNRGNP